MAGGVPLEQLREMYRIYRESQPPPAPPNMPPPPQGAPPPPPPQRPPTVAEPSLNTATAQASDAADEQLRAAQAHMAAEQARVEANRATAESVAAGLQGTQTPAQQMTHNLNAAAAAAAATQAHDGSEDARKAWATWVSNHAYEISSYMENTPGVNAIDAARDVYSLLHGNPVRRGPSASTPSAPTETADTWGGANGSSDPTPSTQTQEPSTELRIPRAAESKAKRQRRHRAIHMSPEPPRTTARLLAKPKINVRGEPVDPIPEPRINWGRGRAPRTTDQPKPREKRRSRSPARQERQSRIGPTQRRAYELNPRRL